MKKFCAWMAAILVVVLAACGGSNDPAAPAPAPAANPNALFLVGAASVSIAPQAPVFAGGSSDKAKPAIQQSNDPLEVRALRTKPLELLCRRQLGDLLGADCVL